MMSKYTLSSLTAVFALALLLTAAPALADDVDVEGENEKTGADSTNTNSHSVTNDGDVDLDNDGDVDNDADATANTGGNDQEENTEAGDLDSGAVDASTDWRSVLNNATGLSDGDGLEVDGDFGNDTTGADSGNVNTLDVDNSGDWSLTNMADVLNELGLDADTGDNDQTKNTSAGDIESGDVDGDFGIQNFANNDSGFSGAASGDTEVDVEGENETTGADSSNVNSFTVENTGNKTVENDADFDNDVDVDADTGGNTQDKNTEAGDIESGDVDVETDVVNAANNGSSMSSAGNGELEVDGDFGNDTTGADSDNDNVLSVDNSGDTTVRNNAELDNDLNVTANSGDNSQSRNTTAGDTETGDVSIDFGVTNDVNNN